MLSWTRLDLDIEVLRHVADIFDQHRVHVAVGVAALAAGAAGSAFWVTLFTVIVAILLWLDLRSTRQHCLACRREVEAIEAPLADLFKRRSILQAKLEAAQLRLTQTEDATQTLIEKLQQPYRPSAHSNASEESMGEPGVPSETPLLPTPQRHVRKVMRADSMYALQKVELQQLQQACEALITCVRWAHGSTSDSLPPARSQKAEDLAPETEIPQDDCEPEAADAGQEQRHQHLNADLDAQGDSVAEQLQSAITEDIEDEDARRKSTLSLESCVAQEGSLRPMPTSCPTTPARSATTSPTLPTREVMVPPASDGSSSSSSSPPQQPAQLVNDVASVDDQDQCRKEEATSQLVLEEDDLEDEEEEEDLKTTTPSMQRIAFSMDARGVRAVIPAGRSDSVDREQVATPTGASSMSGISSAMGTEAISSVLESWQGTVDSSFATLKDTVSRHLSFGRRV